MLKIEDLKVGDLIEFYSLREEERVIRQVVFICPNADIFPEIIIEDKGKLNNRDLEKYKAIKLPYQHQMKLEDKWFKEIDNKPEFRLLDEKRQLIKLNNVIEFTNIDTGEKVLRKVNGLEIVEFYNGDIHGGISEYNFRNKKGEIIKQQRIDKIQKGISIIYTKEQIDKYGLVAIHTEKVGEWD